MRGFTLIPSLWKSLVSREFIFLPSSSKSERITTDFGLFDLSLSTKTSSDLPEMPLTFVSPRTFSALLSLFPSTTTRDLSLFRSFNFLTMSVINMSTMYCIDCLSYRIVLLNVLLRIRFPVLLYSLHRPTGC